MVKMTRVFRLQSACAVIILSVMLLLEATAEDGTTTKSAKTSEGNLKSIPFLQSEAENWSFQNQIQKTVSEYLRRVEVNAKQLMRTRYKFGRAVKIPDYSTDLGSKAHASRRLNGTAHFADGWANGFPEINLVGVNSVGYGESTLQFRSDVNFWKRLVFTYKYKVFEDSRDFEGQIKADIKDARYYLTFALDLPTKTMELTGFRRKNTGAGDVHAEGNSRLSGMLTPIFSGFCRDSVFPDVEAVMGTILEDSFKGVNVSQLLPKVDYGNEHPAPQRVDAEALGVCDTDAATDPEGDALPWESVTELPFILNTGEMWAFQRQMDTGLNQLMEQVADRVTEHLTERELLRAKLADDMFLMNVRDQTSTTRHGPMALSDGWFSSPFRVSASRVRGVEFRDGAVDFEASFQLEDPVEFVHHFKADFLRKEYEGEAKGSVGFLEYALKFSLELESAALILENPKLDCVRETSIALTGLESEGMEWFSSELKRNILKRFWDSTLLQIHAVLSQAFHYVASGTSAERHLPSWNYARNYVTDFELRIGEHDEDDLEVCDAERIRKAEGRLRRFSELIGKDGVFKDLTPDADGKYFTHVSGVKNNAIRFTSTRTQSWYFDRDLRLKMNEYMYNLLRKTAEIIRTRDLGRARMPDYGEAAIDEFGRKTRIGKCWVDGLTSVAVTGVDILEYDQSLITLITNIQVYKDLKFEGDYTNFGADKNRDKGKIVIPLPPMELSLRIDIDYLGEKTAKLEYMKLECVGSNSSGISPPSTFDLISDSLDLFFKEVLAEHLHQIFRHAFEDAMAETKWEEFLPEWDYKRDYITEIILHQNVNRFQSSVDFCNGTEEMKSLKEFYPDLETLEFSHFLPDIKIAGLRGSFQRQIHVLMGDAVRSMWRNMLERPLQRFNPLKFTESGLSLEPKAGAPRISLIFSVIDFQGLTGSGADLEEVDLAYGKEDTLTMLYQQSWDSFKATFDLSLADGPSGERERGSAAVATAAGLEYLLKVRFFLSNSTFSVDEFFLRCLRNLTVSVQGLRPGREWMLDSVEGALKSHFEGSLLPEISELLFILYGYAAEQLDTRLYAYSWTYDRDLFKMAAAPPHEEEKQHQAEEAYQPCEAKTAGANTTVIARGNVPFIGSEAEWWSFSRQTRGQIDRYMREVKKMAREFLRDHALQEPTLPDLEMTVSRGRSDAVVCKLTEGVASNLMNLKYVDHTRVEVIGGGGLKILTLLTIDGNLKMRYRIEARSGKESASGRVRSIAKSLIFRMIIAVGKKKPADLQTFDVMVLSDIETSPRVPKKSFSWLEGRIPEAFEGNFTSLAQGDVKRMLKMAFKFGVTNADVAPQVRDWNYQKDYGARSRGGVEGGDDPCGGGPSSESTQGPQGPATARRRKRPPRSWTEGF